MRPFVPLFAATILFATASHAGTPSGPAPAGEDAHGGHAAAKSAPAAAVAPRAAVPAPHAAAAEPTRTPAVVALASLIRGNDRFASGRPTHPQQAPARRRELASGQRPAAIVFSCADSRVPPEIVFDQGLGEIFVVRAAGQVLDHATVASLEYAVEHLHAPLLVVMGHHACGAVKAAITVAPGQAGSEDLDYLVGAIQPAVAKFGAPAAGDTKLDRPVRAQVNATVQALLARSAIVRGHVAAGQLSVIPAVYALDSGAVEMWDAAPALAGDH